MAQIIAHWGPHQYYGPFGSEQKRPELTPVLVLLDDPSLIRAFIGEVMPRDRTLELSPALVKTCEKHGWATFQNDLIALLKSTTIETLPRNIQLVEQLCSARSSNKERKELCGILSQEVLAALEAVLEGLRHAALARTEARLGGVRTRLDPLLPEARRKEALAKKALWPLVHTPGVSAVLLGMRSVPYVEDAFAVMRWPAFENPQPILEAMRGGVA